jgi:hypothetical protein
MASTTLDGKPAKLEDYKGKWIMLKVGPSDCQQECQDQLFAMRQLRTMQGKEMERIERVWLITDEQPLETMLLRVNDGTRMLRAPADVLKWLPLEGRGSRVRSCVPDRPAGQPDDALPERRGVQRYREGQAGPQGHR